MVLEELAGGFSAEVIRWRRKSCNGWVPVGWMLGLAETVTAVVCQSNYLTGETVRSFDRSLLLPRGTVLNLVAGIMMMSNCD